MMAPTDDDVLEHLHVLMHQFKSQMQQALRRDDGGLAPMEARALGFFARSPGSSASDLVGHSQRDKAQVTRLVKALLDRGLLVAVADPADARRSCLRLTDAGRVMQRAMQQQRKRWAATLVKDFSADDRERLVGLLARMRANIAPLASTGAAGPEPVPTRHRGR